MREAADPQVKAVLDGVEATDRQLMQTLERYGVKPVDTDGEIRSQSAPGDRRSARQRQAARPIVDVVQAGYMIGDRLLRPAMVTVAKKEAPAEAVWIPRSK